MIDSEHSGSPRRNKVGKYIKLMRLDHWIKQLFILPGAVASFFLTDASFSRDLAFRFCAGFVSACLIASANYVINEWLDAEFDQYHPMKKNRSVPSEGVSGRIVWLLWGCLSAFGLAVSLWVNTSLWMASLWLWLMGLLYNVKPFRTKDIPILDVLTESVNNAIRLLMGWFIVSMHTLPPSSLILGYWMAGAFLMASKRFAEFRMFNDRTKAGMYRRSYLFYTEKSLLLTVFLYAMCSVFFLGIFLVKYRVELVLLIPILIGLFGFYFWLSFAQDSAVQKPEKLFHEKGLMIYCLVIIIIFIVLMTVNIPSLSILTDSVILTFPSD